MEGGYYSRAAFDRGNTVLKKAMNKSRRLFTVKLYTVKPCECTSNSLSSYKLANRYFRKSKFSFEKAIF